MLDDIGWVLVSLDLATITLLARVVYDTAWIKTLVKEHQRRLNNLENEK